MGTPYLEPIQSRIRLQPHHSFSKSLSTRAHTQSQSPKPFVSHMCVETARCLRVYDSVDHRDCVGKFYPATIIASDPLNSHRLRIHYDGFAQQRYDVWCDYEQELWRFANYRSISRRKRIDSSPAKFKVGDTVEVNAVHTMYGGAWRRGTVHKIDRKSDQIQIAFRPRNEKNGDFVLYWTHIDNTSEFRAATLEIEKVSEESERTSTKRRKYKPPKRKRTTTRNGGRQRSKSFTNRCFSAWSTAEILAWVDSIEGGRFKNEEYEHFKEQIKVIGLKGYELTTLNETALKFAGLSDVDDRNLVINAILDLGLTTNEESHGADKTTTRGNGANEQKVKAPVRPQNERVLKEVLGLWDAGM